MSMNPDPKHSIEPKRPLGAERPLPWRCRHCGKDEVIMTTASYDAELRHDGRLYSFTIPHLDAPVCQACGEKVFTERVDDQINAALRSHLHLLTPEEIRTALERIRMTQKGAADRHGQLAARFFRLSTSTRCPGQAGTRS